MKKPGHCTIRNEKLFCSHCGQTLAMPFPISVDMFSAMAKVFAKEHKHCPPTWKQPEADQLQSVNEKARWWVENGEQGTSSKTIFSVIHGGDLRNGFTLLKPSSYCHPYDPDDFRRCYLLLKAVPEWRAELDKMRTVSKQWNALVDNWDKLTGMLEEQMKNKKRNGMYEFMQSLGC